MWKEAKSLYKIEISVGIPSPWLSIYDHDQNEKEKRVNLDLLPKTRGKSLLKAISYKLKMTRFFNH